MEGWKGGRVEGWKKGRVERWKGGGRQRHNLTECATNESSVQKPYTLYSSIRDTHLKMCCNCDILRNMQIIVREVRNYITPEGRNPFRQWLIQLKEAEQ